ncbi:L,D-transpeptidase family protein [Legionella worsleiensis]|uniref:Putative ErfK/YbiS/YcfS/YnhG family protein n=1 Tax=Legionella worsleiensis TaxID=45076 RepID=A0A0W1A7D4_9GAMM|nr:L,D-transpeptidase family protein [Legionella worsleiensis]KTD76963.1 putative ErfK/YbiS/YcfS/YnhG family protein precursor [Legionella worsleiensis]STY33365.1 putative ErfK/YbiS/YcfS/YnhG family protein precursor [Legionella worsleiensis]
MLIKRWLLLCASLSTLLANQFHAATYVLPASGDVVGEVQYTYSLIDETIDEVGRRFDVGYQEMVRANPHADPMHTLAPHTRLLIPSQYILPDVPKKGIVINLAEYRLYYFPAEENIVVTFPVGIGKEGWNTPLGLTRIVNKTVDPVWRPTPKIRAAAEEMGAPLPEVFPAGSHNPLGRHVLRLGWPAILIHGTNRTDGVGMRVSAGCIRMLPEDIEHLYELAGTGTPVRVINESVKVGIKDGVTYIQAYPLLKGQKNSNSKSSFLTLLKRSVLNTGEAHRIMDSELKNPSGLLKQINTH